MVLNLLIQTWLGQEEHLYLVVAQVLHMLRLLNRNLGRDL